jgi:ligand-binding sensor domain-containing protein
MKTFLLLVLFLLSSNIPAQNPEWKLVKPTNTGIQGNAVYSIVFEGENMWVSGDDQIWDEGGASVYNGSYWKNYSSVDGNMPSHEVHKIFIASNGDKWFSTDNGLMRLRGEQKTMFNTSNSPFPSNYFTDIEEDANGNIWVGIGEWYLNILGGIGKYDGSSWTIYENIYPDLLQNTPEHLFFDDQGILWVGWVTGGLMKFDGTNWTYIIENFNTYRGGDCSGMVQDSSGSMWFTTSSNGFGRLTGTTWTWWDRNILPELGTDGFSKVIVAGYNSVYVSTYTGVVFKFNGTIEEWHVWQGSHIYNMAIGPDGGIWAGGLGGVEKLTGTNQVFYNVQNTGLPDRWLNYINVDNSNNKWFCSPGGAVSKFDGVNWRDFNPYNFGAEPWPFPTDVVNQVLFDKFGNTWAAIDGGGVGKWDGQSWTRYEAGLTANWVISVGIDSSQTIWAGLYNWGLGKLNQSTGTFTMYDVSNSPLPDNYVYAFAANADSSIWIGTGYGLALYKNDNWTIYNTGNSGIPYDWVLSLAKDPSGNLWVGTADGIGKFDGSNWTVYNSKNSNIPASVIYSIAVSNTGTVWIGCFQGSNFPYTGGIAKFDGTSWTAWTTANSPLPHNQVKTVALDKLGNLWIGTSSEAVAVFREGGIVTGVQNTTTVSIPKEYQLDQNYPNPFNPSTTIKFHIQPKINNNLSKVKLVVYNILGKEVATLINQELSAGNYEVKFDGNNYSSGLYFYRLEANGFVQTKKMTLIK